jgi:hypothetical protein
LIDNHSTSDEVIPPDALLSADVERDSKLFMLQAYVFTILTCLYIRDALELH